MAFYLNEVPPSRVRKQVIAIASLRSWLEHLGYETWDVVAPDDIKSWISEDLLETCVSFEPVSESDYCQIGMTAIVMGDVNAMYTLECAHRRQMIAARALNERSPLIRGLTFPRTKTVGDVNIDVLVFFFCNFRTCISLRCPLKCDVPTRLTTASKCPRCGPVWQYTHGRVLGRTPRRRAHAFARSEKHLLASTSPALQPRLWLQAGDVE